VDKAIVAYQPSCLSMSEYWSSPDFALLNWTSIFLNLKCITSLQDCKYPSTEIAGTSTASFSSNELTFLWSSVKKVSRVHVFLFYSKHSFLHVLHKHIVGMPWRYISHMHKRAAVEVTVFVLSKKLNFHRSSNARYCSDKVKAAQGFWKATANLTSNVLMYGLEAQN
jgi:hypothetical protein